MEPKPTLPGNEAHQAAGMASLTRMLRILFFCFLTLIAGVFSY